MRPFLPPRPLTTTRPDPIRVFEVGIDWKTASLPLVGQASVRSDELPRLLSDLASSAEIDEVVVLSTCNRFEVYAAPASDEAIAAVTRFVAARVGIPKASASITRRTELDALRHLVGVAAGLESGLLGEHEVLGQVRRARAAALAAGTAGPTLAGAFQHAVRRGRSVRRRLGLARVRRSMTDFAADWLASRVTDPGSASAVLVVAGETAAQVARHLRRIGIQDLVVVNRSRSSAERLAARFGARVSPLESLVTLLRDADIAVFATASSGPLVTAGELERDTPLVAVDLGLPANVDEKLADDGSVELLTFTEIQARAVAASSLSIGAKAEAATLLDDAVDELAA